jgi:hypothetical protein
MKIVASDNYGRDYISEYFVNDGADMNLATATGLAADLNEKSSQWYYKVVSDDYDLYTFEP